MSSQMDMAEELDPFALDVALSAVQMKLRKLVIKEFTTGSEKYADLTQPPPPSADPALGAMEDLVASIEQNKDVRGQYTTIQRLIHGQDTRAEIFASLSQTHDYGRFVKFLKARSRVEHVLLAVANRGELTPSEALAMLDYLTTEIKGIERKLGATSVTAQDIMAMLAKIDTTIDQQNEQFGKNLEGTSPQTREIVRRVAFKLLKTANATPAK